MTGSPYRVLMNFQPFRGSERVSFLERECKTVLPRKLIFATEERIRVMHEKCGSQLLEDIQALEHVLGVGLSGAWLNLTEE